MEAAWAKTFDEYVGWMAINSPHATVLDWWRRIELALEDYAVKRSITARARGALEAAVARDPRLGSDVAARLAEMRRLRNGVAHGTQDVVSPAEAVVYARQALNLIGALLRSSGEGEAPSSGSSGMVTQKQKSDYPASRCDD